jgi:co-chaperonin GroES (HSP10)
MLRLLADNVLVEIEPPPQQHGAIILPQNQSRKQTQAVAARVLAAGPGYVAHIPTRPDRKEEHGERRSLHVHTVKVFPEVKVGDRVLVEYMAGDRVGGGGYRGDGDRRIVRESEIAAVVGEGVEVV